MVPYLTLVTLLCLTFHEVQSSCPKGDPKPWIPEWLPRNDLLCRCEVDDVLGPNEEQLNEFCKCNAYPKWQYEEQLLEIEYVSVFGKSLIIPESAVDISEVYRIFNRDIRMTEIPSNLCNWDVPSSINDLFNEIFDDLEHFWKHIVSIDFSYSSITALRDLNCLERLDTLNLRGNKLTHVSNTSFHKLRQLREVDLAYNLIKTLDPAVTSGNLTLMFIDFSYNDMITIDVSNMYSHRMFCIFDYKNNTMNEMVNELMLKVDSSYGPGFVNLQNNVFETFPDFVELLDLVDIHEIGKVISFGFDFRGIQLECDCNLQPFRSLADDVLKAIWRDYHNVTCVGPEKHVGKLAFDVPREELICPLKDTANLTAGCTYVDVPENDTMYVNCHGLTKLPKYMPISKFSNLIHLNVSHNHIEHIDNVTYLNKLSALDISYNDLKVLEHETALQMENASYIDISNNPKLRVIPHVLQYQNSCSVNGENLRIFCDCDSLWIITWLANRQCPNDTVFECQVEEHGIMIATSFSEDMVDCEIEDTFLLFLSVMLSGVLVVLIFIATIAYLYKYELLILFLRLRKLKKSSILPENAYDVYIMVDEENDKSRKWVSTAIVPFLEEKGYKVFLPYRDVELGVVRSNAIIEKINATRTSLMILSESYLANENCKNEWKYAWNLMVRNKTKKLVLINFDFISSFGVEHPQIRAYLRVGNVIEFKNWSRDMQARIVQRIGPPQHNPISDGRALDNKKATFAVKHLFEVVDKMDPYDDLKGMHRVEVDDSENDNNIENKNNDCLGQKVSYTEVPKRHDSIYSDKDVYTIDEDCRATQVCTNGTQFTDDDRPGMVGTKEKTVILEKNQIGDDSILVHEKPRPTQRPFHYY